MIPFNKRYRFQNQMDIDPTSLGPVNPFALDTASQQFSGLVARDPRLDIARQAIEPTIANSVPRANPYPEAVHAFAGLPQFQGQVQGFNRPVYAPTVRQMPRQTFSSILNTLSKRKKLQQPPQE